MPQDEWTPAEGLKRAAIALLARCAICLLCWLGLVWLVTPFVNELPNYWLVWVGIATVMVIPGFGTGYFIGRRLNEIAAMQSLIVTIGAALCAWIAIIGGMQAAHALRPLGEWQAYYMTVSSGVFATLIIAKMTMLDE